MIKKQTRLIIIAAAVFVILLLAYLIVVRPLIANEETDDTPELLPAETNAAGEVTDPGEALGQANSILMYPQITREMIARIEVSNKFGQFAFYYDKNDKEFYIEDNINAPYSKEVFAQLVVAVGYSAAMDRVTADCKDFSEYGLDDNEERAVYRITTNDGKEYVAYVGSQIVTGAGYYAKFNDRNAVYVINATSGALLKGSINNLISPVLTLTPSQTDYFLVNEFTIAKRDEDGEMQPFFSAKSKTKKGVDDSGNETEEFDRYEMVYPSGYSINTSNYDTILQGFMELSGNRVVHLGKDGATVPAETLALFGLEKPEYELYINYKGTFNSIVLSEKTENDTYFAYSLLFNTIVEVDSSSLDFLEWDLLEFIDKPLFTLNVADVASIAISGNGIDETFIITLDEATDTQKAKGIKVRTLSGKEITDVTSFRSLYMRMLTLSLVTYAEVDSTEGLDLLATFTLITRDGQKYEFKFYPYTTRRCLYSANGDAEFYVIKESVDRIVEDAVKVLNGETVRFYS